VEVGVTFHHGDRVRLGGFEGKRGVVLRCQKRTGPGHYFKVKLDNGSWVWPDGAVVDSIGTYELTCSECAGLFRSNAITEVFCPNCERRMAPAYISGETRNLRASLRGTRAATPRERSTVDPRDLPEDESPF
jgi:hypothetical protein